ncbi:hypothetical protein H8959_006607 [Pygathrix nigripes]
MPSSFLDFWVQTQKESQILDCGYASQRPALLPGVFGLSEPDSCEVQGPRHEARLHVLSYYQYLCPDRNSCESADMEEKIMSHFALEVPVGHPSGGIKWPGGYTDPELN